MKKNREKPVVISVEDASVTFHIRDYQFHSFKEWVMLGLGKKNSFREIKALKDISVDIHKGESVAFIGHNGSGKSTLLKVIAGVIELDKGVDVRGRVGPMIELGTGFDPELSGLENIYLACTLMGLSEKQIAERVDEIVRFAELEEFITVPFKNYSSGMQARLGFACTTAVDPDILLVDEVLAVGDANFAKKCLDRIHSLREKGCTIVMVSHDESAVRAFCERGVVLENGKMRFDGPVNLALDKHNEIMKERYLASLPKKEREEKLRKEKLSSNDAQTYDEHRPEVIAEFYTVQGGDIVPRVDTCKPFDLEFLIRITNLERVKGNLSIGFAINHNGRRIGGANNQQLSYNVPKEKIPDNGPFRARFSFDEGIPSLMAEDYEIVLGIHDRDLTRTLFIAPIGTLRAFNSNSGPNTDGDLIDFPNQTSTFSVVVSNGESAHRDPEPSVVN